MKPIREDEFREYMEFKKFMGKAPGAAGTAGTKSKAEGRLSLEELDQVTAARGDQEFVSFLREMKRRKENGED